MGFKDYFSKTESLFAVDIGAGSLKIIELDITGDKPVLVNLGQKAMTPDIFSNNLISKAEKISEQLSMFLESNSIADKRVVTAMPSPMVFTKKIKVQKVGLKQLRENILLEASSYIPHKGADVKIDFHIIGETGKNQMEVLIVAVKEDVVQSYTSCLGLAGLDTAVVDVDYFALQNAFELAYPEKLNQTVALVNIGARYTSVNITRGGQSLFTGDISLGGKLFTEALATELGITYEQAEAVKKDKPTSMDQRQKFEEVIDKNVEYVAAELNRQISFYWNAAGADGEGIDCIMLSGGTALVPGLLNELQEKTGINCEIMDPFRGIVCGANFDKAHLSNIGPMMAIGIGMAIRQAGDREVPDFL